jgi:hypothetical protein
VGTRFFQIDVAAVIVVSVSIFLVSFSIMLPLPEWRLRLGLLMVVTMACIILVNSHRQLFYKQLRKGSNTNRKNGHIFGTSFLRFMHRATIRSRKVR